MVKKMKIHVVGCGVESSLICVYIVCNLGCPSTWTDNQADNSFHEWVVKAFFFYITTVQ